MTDWHADAARAGVIGHADGQVFELKNRDVFVG
jgi:hypothetical protein